LFGFHCAYLFLRTGSIFPSISSHIFCNIMGLPQLPYSLNRFPRRRPGGSLSYFLHVFNTSTNFVSPAVIVALYLVGIAGYIFTMKHWTLNPLSLYWKDQMNAPGAATY
jgi:prenyl protein peptidase